MAGTNEEAAAKGTETAPEAKRPKRVSRIKREREGGKLRLRLNARQTADLNAESVPAGALRTELTAALVDKGHGAPEGRWYYWDDTSVIFASPQLAEAVYRWTFGQHEAATAHLVGARALRKQILKQGAEVPDLEAELRAARAEAEKAA